MTVPHFRYPFTLSGSSFATWEQDTVDEIRDCLTVLLLTPVGSRVALPSYGTPEIPFAQAPVQRDVILSAIRRWEERAAVTLTDDPDALDQLVRHIGVSISGGRPS